MRYMKKKVLLVEREWEFGGRLPELLVEMGFEVEVAASGALALSSLKESFPDLIVAENQMTGFEDACFVDCLGKLKLLEHIPVLVTVDNSAQAASYAKRGVYTRSRPYEAEEMAKFVSLMA